VRINVLAIIIAVALTTAGVHIAYMDSLLHLQYIYGRSGVSWSYESPLHSGPYYFRNEPDIALDDTNGVHISYNERERPWYQYKSATGWIEEQVSYDYADNDIARTSIKVGSDDVVRMAYWGFGYDATLHERIDGMVASCSPPTTCRSWLTPPQSGFMTAITSTMSISTSLSEWTASGSARVW